VKNEVKSLIFLQPNTYRLKIGFILIRDLTPAHIRSIRKMINKTAITNSVIRSSLLVLGLSVLASADDNFKLTVLYNNVPLDERLTTGWGFSCLILGGFHLGGYSEHEVKGIIERLREMGVKKVAPSHCTGEASLQLFKEAWGEDFLAG